MPSSYPPPKLAEMLPGGTIRSALKTRLGEAGGYAVAITAALLCALLRLLVDPLLGNEAGLLLFVPAILAAAMAGGAGPTFVAATLSIGSSLAIARFHLDGDAVVRIVVFILIALSVGWLGSRMLRNGRELERFVGALHEREVRLQSILETIPDALVIIDERGAIDALSPAAERLFGWSGAELKGRNVALLMPEPDRSRHDAYLGRYLATGEKRVIGKGRVLIGQRCDGSTFPMQLAVGEMVLGSKRLFTGFVRDLTERQDADRRLRDVQGELLHVSRLASLGEMTSALAHEFNQPLAAATSYMEGSLMLLERAPIDFQRLKAMIGQGGEQTWRAGEILRRMRDFSVRGETEQRIERLSPLLQEAAALALVGPGTRDVRLSFQIDPAADAARIDKVQIQQVVVNLVRNGIEAMEGAADKSLALGTSPAANGMVEVWVSDRGAGLSEAAASTLFEPFRSTKPGGMGIGLSISRTIIDAHGGQISILSAPRSSASRYPACMPRRVAMSEPRVHLIDDEDSVRNAMSFILDMADLPSRSYASALEFLDVAGSIREGCVVTDLRMPHMSGLELITRMKQLGLGLPVVMISGHGDIPIAVEAMRAGVVDFIEKPFKKDALLDAIRRALDSEASRAAAQSSRRRFEEMIATLSPRQTDVLRGVIAGKMNKTIANELGISIRTVEVHRAHVMSKTHAASLSELVRIAMSAGF